MALRKPPSRVIGGRYRLDVVLGTGGFGRVWKAYDERLNADVAVKEVWLPPTVSDAERRQRLLRTEREAHNAAQLRDNPHVVAVHDVVIEDDTPWIVMRLVVGRSLQELVDADGPVSVAEATQLATALLSALGAAHAADIVHRDVKPANVMVSSAGDVLLTDFGIAVHKADPALTDSRMVVGSPEYSAPERLCGKDGQPASDLFSLGATLYFAVEGRSPFRRDTIEATIAAVLRENPPPPQRAGPVTPLITALLNKNPAKRPTIPRARQMLNSPPPKTRATAAVVAIVVTLLVLALMRSLTSDDETALDQASTDTTPQTVDSLLPQSFTAESTNAYFTLRSSGVQNCITGNEGPFVQEVLQSVNCTDAIVGTYVNAADRILISVWVVPLADAETAIAAESQLSPIYSDAWGYVFPAQGPGSELATVDPQYVAAATQIGYLSTSHRYLIHTVALFIDLTQDRSLTPWVDAAAWQAVEVVGPLNYSGNN